MLDRAECTVPAQLRRRAAERPDDIAHRLVGGEDLTFGRWDAASNAAARGLIDRGVRAGDRVLLPASSATWTAYAVAWAAVLKVGAVAVPVARSSGPEQIRNAGRASRAVCVVDGDSGLPDAANLALADLAAGQPTDEIHSGPAPDDDAEIIYTSGTTGLPKGVVATHANVLYPQLRSSAEGSARTALHALQPATTVGQGLLVQPLGARPHRTFTLAHFDPAELLAAVERHRPTDVVLVPAMAIALVDAAARVRRDVSSVRQVRTTSAPIHPATLEALAELFPAARIRNVYSTTECWPRRLATDYDRARPTSLGRPAAGSQVRIVDAAGREVAAGTPGDVQLRSDAPQRRYDGEVGVSEVFLPDGWTRTGDVGLLDEDGYFHLLDRSPDLVNTGGLNVSTLEVEAAIMDWPGVIEAAVFGVRHPVLTECVTAAIRCRPGVDTEAVLRFLRERKGPAAPRRIAVVDDLPRNLLGKIDKKQLRKDFERDGGDRGVEPPATATESYLAKLWAVTLDVDRVSATDDFLQLGGSSLTAMEVISEVTEQLGRAVTVRDLLDTTSLRAFAERVDAAPVTGPCEPVAAPEPQLLGSVD